MSTLSLVSARPDGRAPGPDTALLTRARAGEAEAFAEIYRQRHEEVRRYARRLLRTAPALEVDDVVAEAFTNLLRALQNGRGPLDNAGSYLMVTVRNAVASAYRRGQLASSAMTLLTAGVHGGAFEVDLADEELAAALRSLQPRWRKVLWWTEIEGRSLEIGVVKTATPGV